MGLMNRIFRLLFFVCFPVFAWGGNVKGILTDKVSGEPLSGASVQIKPSGKGTVCGIDGSYQINNLPEGAYTLTFKYLSYKTLEVEITITNSTTITKDVVMEPVGKMLGEINVKANFKDGSEQQARNQEKTADQQMNIISARAIQLLPDITVANVLQRVSGVAVQRDATGEARYAIIRGMDKRYNTTTVNGVKIPSPDDKARYVPMDIFPAEILERLEVVKSLTPDLEADAIGGIMNMVLKHAPDHLEIHASAATGVNQTLLDRSYTSFNSADMKSQDPYKANGPTYVASDKDFPRSAMVLDNKAVMPNGMASLSIGNRFGKDKKFGALFSGSFQNTYKGSSSIFFKPSALPDINNVAQFTDLEVYKYDKQQTRTGLNGLLNYDLNSKNSLVLYGLFVQLNEKEVRNVIDTAVSIQRTGAGTGPVDITSRSAIRKQQISSISMKGNHLINKRFSADWILNYNRAQRLVPDMTELHTSTGVERDGSGNLAVNPEFIKNVHHSWETTTEQDQQGFLNLHYLLPIAGKDVEIIGGGMYRHKTRDNYFNEYLLNGKHLFGNIQTDTLIIDNGYLQGTQPHNYLTYTATENISAAYAEAKFMLGAKLQVLAGARVEHTYQHYNMAQDPNVVVGQNGTYNYTDILPGLHFKYLLNRNTNIRFSYFESITRPALFELTPYVFSGEEFNETGNYSLKHSTAHNLDLRYEWFKKGQDQILIGAFYKHILNPIEYSLDAPAGPSALVLRPTNPFGVVNGDTVHRADNFGLELQATKFFHYFGVSVNYTYTNSTIHAMVVDYHTDPVTSAYLKDNVVITRPMQGQSAHIGNLSFLYKNPIIGFDAQLAFAYTGDKIAFLSNFKDLNYWQKGITLLDLSFEQRLHKRLSIYAKVNNLLNTPTIVELRQDKTRFVSTAPGNYYQLPYQDLPNSVIVRKELFGQNYLLGIRFRLD